jgi:hypothetical protein
MNRLIISFFIVCFLASCNQVTETKNAAATSDSTGVASSTLNDPGYLTSLEFKNDYPTNETASKLYNAIDFQRACQAYIWAIPIVSINEAYKGNYRDFGANFNDVVIVGNYLTPSLKGLTGNNSSIYCVISIDLSQGPIVIESPLGIYGVIDDWWQRPVSEVGPLGPDKGKGGKFLLLPPNYTAKIPAGYFPVPSTTNKNMYLGRAFVKNGDVTATANSLKQVKVYALSKAANPPATNYRDGTKPCNTIPPRGFEYWERLAEIINSEPVQERDRFFMAMLKPLGIEKGKPFNPDERQKKILTEAADFGYRMAQTISMQPRFDSVVVYPKTHWEWVLMLNPNQETANYSQLDERTDYTFEALTVAKGMKLKIPGAGSQYLSAAKDKDGEWLDGAKNYLLHIPANAPVKEFWSIIVYDNGNRSMINNGARYALSSDQPTFETNSDGSVDIYFGPSAPSGKEKNWIKTIPGKGWFTYFRAYSPTEAFFDKSWRLPDIEKIK